MATTTVAHASLIRYDNDGNQLVINLKNTGDDVSINRSTNGNLPAGATTAQGLANSLGALAFKNSLSKADVGLENVDNTADANKSVNYASSAGLSSKLSRVSHLSSVEELDNFLTSNIFQYATVGSLAPFNNNDGIILSASWRDSTNYGHQIYIDDNSSLMMQRGRNSGTWGSWVKMIDSSNIGSQSVNYANTAGSANAVAWDSVTGKPSTYTPSSHTHTKSQITDFPTSLPASDVSAWAKADSKPSYSKSEIGLGNVDNTADSAKSVKYATSAGSANAVAWGNVTGKPSTYTPSSHTHAKSEVGLGNVDNTADANKSVNYATTAGATTKVALVKHLSTTEELDGFVETNTFQYATVASLAPIKNDGIILSASWKDNPNYAHQIYIDDNSSAMMQRGRNNGTWGNWVRVIDSSNIGSQSVNYATTAGSSDSASSATKATSVVDYNNTDCRIDIGYNGSGISGDAIKYIAGYTTGANGSTARIKDISKSALIGWMGVLPGDSIFYVSKEAPTVPCIWAKID